MNSPSSPNSSHRLPAWLLLLVALGIVPSALALTFFQALIQHPLLFFLFLLLYLVLLLLVSIVTVVWQKLQNPWTDRLAQLLDRRLMEMLSGYRKYYCQRLIYQCRFFDVKGLSTQGISTLELNQVFVEPHIALKPPHQTSADLLKVPESLPPGQYTIWDYLRSKDAAMQRHLVILGTPGSGKTTLLQHIVLMLVSRKKRRKLGIPYLLPVFLFLRECGNELNNLKEGSSFSLVDAIYAQLGKWERPVPTGWVERQLASGKCLILLDGLDEVADLETRHRLIDWLDQQMVAYGNNRFVITSRPFGYLSNPLAGVTVLEVQLFTYDQIEQFVTRWYLANEMMSTHKDDPGVRQMAKDGATDLFRRLRNTQALFKLSVNPLLLTMIATVHRYRATLPDQRVTLYEEICEVFLGKRQEARGIKLEMSPVQKQEVLQHLAYSMMEKEQQEIPLAEAVAVIKEPLKHVSIQMTPEEFLHMIENSSGLLLEREFGTYAFAHLTFQEYLAARYIREYGQEKVLVDQIGNNWWRETILLYGARADATSLIAACLAMKPLSASVFQLVMELQEEANRMEPSVRIQINNLLSQAAEDEDPEKRHLIAEALLARRLQRMVPLSSERQIDVSLMSHVEYQLFLDEERTQGHLYPPDHWIQDHFPAGQGFRPVSGLRPSDAMLFCRWLTRREADSWLYRLPTTSERLAVEEHFADIDKLEVGIGYWIDEGEGFARIAGNGYPTDDTLSAKLDGAYTQDYERVESRNSPYKREDPRQELYHCLTLSSHLARARKLNNEFVHLLRSIRKRLRERERELQTNLGSTHQRKVELQSQLDTLVKQESEMSKAVKAAHWRKSNLEHQRNSVLRQKDELHAQLTDIHDQKRRLQAQMKRERKAERKRELQAELDSLGENENSLYNQIKQAEDEERTLQFQIQMAEADEFKFQSKPTGRVGDKQAHDLKDQLKSVEMDERNLRAELDAFKASVSPFYTICDRFLTFTITYKKSQVFSEAITRNSELNLDMVFERITTTLENTLSYTGSSIRNFEHGLAMHLVQYKDQLHPIVYDHDITIYNDIVRACDLVQQLQQITDSTHAEQVALLLRRYLKYISQYRSIGIRDLSLLRLYVRYFARELASHLLYWSWKELFSLEKQSLPIDEAVYRQTMDAYFDMYVAFALLEERIEGRIPACEGLLIVRERKEEYQRPVIAVL